MNIIDNHRVISILGRGAGGVVTKSMLEDGRIVSLKKILKSTIKKEFYKEGEIIQYISGKDDSFPTLVCFTENEKNIYIATEYCEGGDLFDVITERFPFYLPDAAKIELLSMLCQSLKKLKELKVLHRDIKPENIIVNYDKFSKEITSFKIIDWGFAIREDDCDVCTAAGTYLFAAPELFVEKCKVGYHNDVWSFGITAFSLLTGDIPFTKSMLIEIVNNDWSPTTRSYVKHELGMWLHSEDFFSRIFVPYEQRASIEELCEHPFLKIRRGL